MRRKKERSRSVSTMGSEPETESEDRKVVRKKVCLSQKEANAEVLEFFRNESRRYDDFMKAFLANAEQERKEQRERWEEERKKEEEGRVRQR